MTPVDSDPPPDRLPALDPVIHAQPRLRVTVVLAALGPEDQITFPRLRALVEMTAGNLSTHLRKLEDAGYVQVTKTHRRRTPVTYLSLTGSGRAALAAYTERLHALLEASGSHPTTEERHHERSRSATRGSEPPFGARRPIPG